MDKYVNFFNLYNSNTKNRISGVITVVVGILI